MILFAPKSEAAFAVIESDYAPSIKFTPLILQEPFLKKGNEEGAFKHFFG